MKLNVCKYNTFEKKVLISPELPTMAAVISTRRHRINERIQYVELLNDFNADLEDDSRSHVIPAITKLCAWLLVLQSSFPFILSDVHWMGQYMKFPSTQE